MIERIVEIMHAYKIVFRKSQGRNQLGIVKYIARKY
jgi:hypothetical protein